MDDIKVEIYCNNCGYEAAPGPDTLDENNSYECPKCHSSNVIRYPHIKCECGDYVYLNSINNTNECECGRLYNNFGQKLSNPSKWDDEDKYETFGPILTDPLDYMD